MYSFTYKRNIADSGVQLTYSGKQSPAKALSKARDVDAKVRDYLKKGGGGVFSGNTPGAKLAGFCAAYGITGEGRKDLARQLLDHAMREQEELRAADQRRLAAWKERQQEHARRVLEQAPAWFYGTEVGCAHVARLFRLCNRAPEQELPHVPTAKDIVRELRKTLEGQGRDADVQAMMPVFAQILGMPKEEAANYFRAEFKAASQLPGTFYRAEVLSGFGHRQGDVLRTQAPTSVSSKEAKARDFFTHRAGHGGATEVKVLYVFDSPPGRRLQTALNESSTGEGEAVVPDRAFFRVAGVKRSGPEVVVHLTPVRGDEARRGPWSWMGHDAGLRLPGPR
ncbi:hypothetical protein ACFP1Z_19055 [Streptomyces gamaensis]|uniref:ADP ribosyltransferase domain-containing protein n=1 Tax=Streptomyces gamaensis TaxID=1763542 RepID=A0ABW0Z2F6_9ACTN